MMPQRMVTREHTAKRMDKFPLFPKCDTSRTDTMYPKVDIEERSPDIELGRL